MENMFLMFLLGKSKTQKKKGKIETKRLGIELDLPHVSGTWEFELLLLLIKGFSTLTRMVNCCALDYKEPPHMGIAAAKLSVYRGCAVEIHALLFITPWAWCESPA